MGSGEWRAQPPGASEDEVMRNEVALAQQWCGDQLDRAVLARVMLTEGFGGRRSGEALVVTDTMSGGALAAGAADAAVIEAARALLASGGRCATANVAVGDSEGVAAGLACGGRLHVLLQRLDSLGTDVMGQVLAGADVVLVTEIHSGSTVAVSSAVIPSVQPEWNEAVNLAARMLTKGPAGTVVVGEGDAAFLVQAVVSTPSLLVFGRAALAEALVRIGGVLGWSVAVMAETQTNAAVTSMQTAGPNDGVVVLSHDVAASCAVLAAALGSNARYLGALGSRHTQGARREHLVNVLNISESHADLVRGPVGLDLGARDPEETALAIVAEMLAVIRNRTAAPLVSTSGAING